MNSVKKSITYRNESFNLRKNVIIALVLLRELTETILSVKIVCYIKGADDIVYHH